MIRRAAEKDLPRVNALLFAVLSVHAEGRPDIFKPGTKKYSDEELLQIFADDSRPVFVWTDENDIAMGYAFCIFTEVKNANNLYDERTLYIDDISVDERFRRRHVATALYEYVRAFARENGCRRITLNVWECNPGARAFYENVGMRPLKTVMEDVL